MHPLIASPLRSPASRAQRGMSLVEVLVALVVLSVGMLGIAVMFVQSVRSSRSAIIRTHAVNLVSDMADRIRANANARDAYDTTRYNGGPSLHACAPDAQSQTGNNCSVEALAEDDLARWILEVEKTLPPLADGAPGAEVRFTEAAGGEQDLYRIRVAWREPNERVVSANNGEANNDPAYSYQSDVILIPRQEVQ